MTCTVPWTELYGLQLLTAQLLHNVLGPDMARMRYPFRRELESKIELSEQQISRKIPDLQPRSHHRRPSTDPSL